MIAILRGNIVSIIENSIVLDVQGVGYQLQATGAVLQSVAVNGDQEVTVHTHLQIREDGIALFGFATLEEKVLFQRIINVSGVGPKIALSILSALSPVQFVLAIRDGNRSVLTKISGVGKKTAERLILELKESLTYPESDQGWDLDAGMPPPTQGISHDAHQALLALGYSSTEAEEMIKRTYATVGELTDLQAFLKAALGQTGKGVNR